MVSKWWWSARWTGWERNLQNWYFVFLELINDMESRTGITVRKVTVWVDPDWDCTHKKEKFR